MSSTLATEMQYDVAYKMVPEIPNDEEYSILESIWNASTSWETMAGQLRLVRGRRVNTERLKSESWYSCLVRVFTGARIHEWHGQDFCEVLEIDILIAVFVEW